MTEQDREDFIRGNMSQEDLEFTLAMLQKSLLQDYKTAILNVCLHRKFDNDYDRELDRAIKLKKLLDGK